MVRSLIRIFLVLVFFIHFGASCPGTETGNPGNAPSGEEEGVDGSPADVSQSAIDDLIDTICQMVNLCEDSITTASCVEALNGQDGDQLGNEFGLPEGEFTTEEIRTGLDDGSIIADSTSIGTCGGDISEVSCSLVTASVSSHDFSNVENFIPDSCGGVFILSE